MKDFTGGWFIVLGSGNASFVSQFSFIKFNFTLVAYTSAIVML